MDDKEFVKQLNKAQDLMKEERYNEAINLIEKMKNVEKKGDFDYNLTHKLYQLDSNCNSLYNQQVILKNIYYLSKSKKIISFQELSSFIRKKTKLELSDDILRREIELLILRNLLACEVEGDLLKF
ncbi:MAG: hypothetical protein ACFFA6_00690 [Promethearchaeota archaeon]